MSKLKRRALTTTIGPASKMVCYNVSDVTAIASGHVSVRTMKAHTQTSFMPSTSSILSGNWVGHNDLKECAVDFEENGMGPVPWYDLNQDCDIPALRDLDVMDAAHFTHQVEPTLKGNNRQSAVLVRCQIIECGIATDVLDVHA